MRSKEEMSRRRRRRKTSRRPKGVLVFDRNHEKARYLAMQKQEQKVLRRISGITKVPMHKVDRIVELWMLYVLKKAGVV